MEQNKPIASNLNTGPIWAVLIVTAWAITHIYSVFFHSLSAPIWISASLIALQCWLYTGIFIVAHDTMHGSLFRGNERLNAHVGTAILFVYAGFNWRHMKAEHHAHHEFSGTERDPDFNSDNPAEFWPWYCKFFLTYFGWKQFFVVFGFTLLYLVIGAGYLNTIIMWAVPAILSSIQLFYFGTYLTHRHSTAFPDHHNSRTNDFPCLLSLLSCFHFGYHHEHHLYPHEPWWRLPKYKRKNGT